MVSEGNALIFVGGTGTGKTTLIKKVIEKAPVNNRFIFDINSEYTDYYNKPLLDFDEFAERAENLRNAFIVFDEATIFLSNRGSDNRLRKILVRKRHTKNNIILVFHSFRQIPRYIFDLSNYAIVFKTNDPPSLIESRFENPELTKVFNDINSSKWLTPKKGIKFSPHKVFAIDGRLK